MDKNFQLANSWYKTKYVARKNRFVMLLDHNGKEIEAYVPNTGRMTEYRFQDHIFYVTMTNSGELNYRIVASQYQDNLVLLDTIKVNDIFSKLLQAKLIKEFDDLDELQREVNFGRSRFDFVLKRNNKKNIIIEVKSCTLCHNGLAMFPDAPTERGRKHIRHLEELSSNNKVYVCYLALTKNAQEFIPNFHIDYDYGKIFQSSKNVNYRAIKIEPTNPVTVKLDTAEKIPIKYDIIENNCTKSGSYILILKNTKSQEIEIGALGEINFQSGYYVYIGSAMINLDKRVKRHYRKRKKQHWHIDYLTKGKMEIKKDYKIRRADRIESKLVQKVKTLSDSNIEMFGASDSNDSSHLFYFENNPETSEIFYKLVLNARTSMTDDEGEIN